MHQVDKVECNKRISNSTDPNEIELKKQPYSFRHKRFNFGDKLYGCKMCTKAFFDSATLARHSRTHCDFRTSNMYKKALPQKTNIHNVGDILYKCEICCKPFFDSSSLTRHVRFHNTK